MCIVDIYQYSIEMIRYKMIHSITVEGSLNLNGYCLIA